MAKQEEPTLEPLAAAYQFVESMVDKSDGGHLAHGPWWYGWALREAFLAGVEWQKKKEAKRA